MTSVFLPEFTGKGVFPSKLHRLLGTYWFMFPGKFESLASKALKTKTLNMLVFVIST